MPLVLDLRIALPVSEVQYRADYNNRPSNAISFMPAIASLQDHREADRFLAASGVGDTRGKQGLQ